MITTIASFAALAAIAAVAIMWLRQRAWQAHAAIATQAMQLRLEQEMARSEAQRERLLDALGDAFLLVDAEANIRFANAAARHLFGDRELVNRSVSETFLDPRLAAALMRCLATGEPAQSSVVLPKQTSPRGDLENRGSNAWLIDVARLPAAAGAEPVTRVILRDVTAEHQTEQIRKDFVANASHELRTPMAIINGYLENLLDDNLVEEPATARHFLTIMRKHSDRIARIVEDMLVISRLESGEAGVLRIEPFSFGSCIKDVLERLESVIRSQQADILVVIPDADIVLNGDRFYWTQVLINLVENALKQNPRPGLRVEICCEESASGHRIRITDNGIGIPTTDLPHIFRRFYRVEQHHSHSEVKGTGLGLSIVKRAIEAHGGTISVTSVPGRATNFIITVPRDPPTASPVPATPDTVSTSQPATKHEA